MDSAGGNIMLFIGFNLGLYCYKDDLEISIAVLDCTASFYNSTKRLVFVSLTYSILLFVVILATFWGSCMLYAQGNPSFIKFDPMDS